MSISISCLFPASPHTQTIKCGIDSQFSTKALSRCLLMTSLPLNPSRFSGLPSLDLLAALAHDCSLLPQRNTLAHFMPSHTLISFLLLRLFPQPLAIRVVLVDFCLLCRALFSSYYMQTSWETSLSLMPSVIIWVVQRWVHLYNKTTWA